MSESFFVRYHLLGRAHLAGPDHWNALHSQYVEILNLDGATNVEIVEVAEVMPSAYLEARDEKLAAVTKERDSAIADMEAAEQRMLGVLDGTFSVGDGTAQREIERLRKESDDLSRYHLEEFARYKQARNEQHERYDVLHAQFTAAQATLAAECVEHVELNGHIEIAEQCRDYLAHEATDNGDPTGKLHDFAESLRIVTDQCDRQHRRANWYEAAHEAGKSKLIEHAVEKALARAQAAAHVYAERVEALGLAADDNDPKVMATAGPIGEAQADLFAALGLLERDASGAVVTKPPAESVEQLRAERDSARMLAEVRGKERDTTRALIGAVTKAHDERVAECELLKAHRGQHVSVLATCHRKLTYLLRDYPGDKETAWILRRIEELTLGTKESGHGE